MQRTDTLFPYTTLFRSEQHNKERFSDIVIQDKISMLKGVKSTKQKQMKQRKINNIQCGFKQVRGKQYLYEEMVATYNEIKNGVTELEAYERFGRRIQLVQYMKLSTLLSQNCKKGSADLLKLLEYESAQAFEERKEMAKRLGEEAGTKLLVPMVMMLFIVLMIIMVPAFMQM